MTLVQSRPADGAIDEFGRVINKAIADIFTKDNFEQAVQKGSDLFEFARNNLVKDQNSLERQVNALNAGESSHSLKTYPLLFFTIVIAAFM